MFKAYNVLINRSASILLRNEYSCRINRQIDYSETIENAFIKNSQEVLDGSKIQEDWFPKLNPDIFISYSHNDEELAQSLACYIAENLGLDVFVDSQVWKSADKLQKILDDEYSKNENGDYVYRKVQLSSSHVHAMLSMAIMQIMDKSEVIFFLNTSNSIPLIDGVIDKTLSPWIYEELMYSQFLKVKVPKKSIYINESIQNKIASKTMEIAYSIPHLKDLLTLNYNDIEKWCGCCNRLSYHNIRQILDTLYNLFDNNVF